MGYELYQSRHKGYEIDNLLDDVKEIKPKVEAMEQGYEANKVKMADGTVLPAFLATQMASKNDISDMATNAGVSQAINEATRDFVDSDTINRRIAAATNDMATNAGVTQAITQATSDFVTGSEVDTKITQATGDFVTESDVEDIISDDFTNKDTLDELSTSEDGNLLFKGQEIKGGGTDVEANPEGEATEELEKIKIGETIFSIPEGGSGGKGGDTLIGFEDYSEEEHVIGKSKNGKPIYRKTITSNMPQVETQGTLVSLSIPFESYNVDSNDYVNLKAYMITNSNVLVPLNYYAASSNGIGAFVQYVNNTKNISIASNNTSWNVNKALIHFEYTKTTDEPGSFLNKMIASQFECTGIGYENYSEDEIVIGKWVDGRPVYRKVLKDCPLPGTTENGVEVYVDYPLNASVDSMINFDGYGYAYGDLIYPLAYTVASYTEKGLRLFKTTFNKANNSIRLYNSNTAYNNKPFTIICEYTKTTDEPNSFTPDMVYNGLIDVSEATDEEVEEMYKDDSN